MTGGLACRRRGRNRHQPSQAGASAPPKHPHPPTFHPPAHAAPNVLIWSAVACSSAFPFLFAPQDLLAKDGRGNIVKFSGGPLGAGWEGVAGRQHGHRRRHELCRRRMHM